MESNRLRTDLLRVVLCVVVATTTAIGQYNPAPTGGIRLVWDVAKWDRQIAEAKRASGVVEEEFYTGYPLSKDKAVRRKQMSLRYAALEHEEHIIRVLRLSRDARQRELAATALGYSRHSRTQVDALVHAASDVDPGVRTAAMKALRAIVVGHPGVRDRIPAPLLD